MKIEILGMQFVGTEQVAKALATLCSCGHFRDSHEYYLYLQRGAFKLCCSECKCCYFRPFQFTIETQP